MYFVSCHQLTPCVIIDLNKASLFFCGFIVYVCFIRDSAIKKSFYFHISCSQYFITYKIVTLKFVCEAFIKLCTAHIESCSPPIIIMILENTPTVLCCTALYNILYCTALYNILYCTIQYTVLHYAIYCTALYNILYCTMQYTVLSVHCA